MANKKMVHMSSSTQSVNIYPSDIENSLKMDVDFCIQTPWSKNIRGIITKRYNGKTFSGYTITLRRGDEVVHTDIGPLDAISVFTGKVLNIRTMKLPAFLRDRVPFALSMNKAKRMSNLDALDKLYKDQMLFHDNAILNNIGNGDDAYIPVRFDFDKFHIVVVSDSYGQYNIEDGFFFFEGFPTIDEAMQILCSIPKNLVDIRRVEWIKSTIEANMHITHNDKEV